MDITLALSLIDEYSSIIVVILIASQIFTLACLAVVARRSSLQSRRIAALLKTEQGVSLEEMVARVMSDLAQAGQERVELLRQLEILRDELRLAVQSIGFVRYNAFPGVGGEMSFSIAALNAERSGFVLTSLFGREEARVYAKEIAKGEARVPLSHEEQAAVLQADQPKWKPRR